MGRGIFRRVLLGVQRELAKQDFKSVTLLDGYNVRQLLSTEAFRLMDVGLSTAEGRSSPPGAPSCRSGGAYRGGQRRPYRATRLHLPCSTDTLIVQAIADGLESAAPDHVVCLLPGPTA